MSNAANLFAFGVYEYQGHECPVLAAEMRGICGVVIPAFDSMVRHLIGTGEIEPVAHNDNARAGLIHADDAKQALEQILREAPELSDEVEMVLRELFDYEDTRFLSPPGPGIESHRDQELQQETCPT